MDRAEYLAEYCASIDCKSKKLGDCDLCMYEKGRADVIDSLRDVFDYDLFKLYSNDDRFISFNNLSLMISDIIEELKEQNIK